MKLQKVKEVLLKFRDSGIPVILFQDVVTKKPSITFSLLLINGGLCLASLIGPLNDAIGGINYAQASDLLLLTGGLYFGRQFQKLVDPRKEEKEEKEDNG